MIGVGGYDAVTDRELEAAANRHSRRGLFSLEMLEDRYDDESDADSVCYDGPSIVQPEGSKAL